MPTLFAKESCLPAPYEESAVAIDMSREEARCLVESIKGHMHSARAELLRLYEGRGWLALEYSSWRDCVTAEFGQGQRALYYQLEAALIERDLLQNLQSAPIPDSQLRALAPLPDAETRREVWAEAIATAEEAGITAAHVKQVAERRMRMLEGRSDQQETPPLPVHGRYSLILADPPWRYDFSNNSGRAVEMQYPTMSLESICELPVPSICADDCVLFLWGTAPKLREALQTMEAWGFTYKTHAIWHKSGLGMGYYFRVDHELLLIGTRGEPRAPEPSARITSVIEASKTRHSEKPEVFREILESLYPTASRVELFCRKPRDGWDVWGNQV
jgi:N6-adenosine-specific RNA methylase IME4